MPRDPKDDKKREMEKIQRESMDAIREEELRLGKKASAHKEEAKEVTLRAVEDVQKQEQEEQTRKAGAKKWRKEEQRTK